MFVPLISIRTQSETLYRRKGGGSGGKGGGSSGGKGSGSSSPKSGGSSSGSSSLKSGGSSSGTGKTSSISSSGTSKSATSYGSGGGKVSSIPSGQLFAGRQVGGGTRGEVFGTRTYGSGYPGYSGRGVSGLGFPFYFWPLAWGGAAIGVFDLYLHNSEYGRYDNSSQPGGVMMTAAFTSTTQNETFRLVSDNTTVTTLIQDIVANCSSSNLSSPSSIAATTYNDSLAAPKPEQVIQYYRASSVVLTLDGYNDTANFAAAGTPDAPLPATVDTTLLNCLNFTIGAAVPLIDSAFVRSAPPSVGLIGLVYLLWSLSSLL